MSSDTEIEEIRRELRLEIDRLRRELATQRQALIEQEATITHQKAEIDELYRCADATAQNTRGHAQCLRLFNQGLGFVGDDNKQTAQRLEETTTLAFNGLMYLETLVCDLYDQLFPKANIAVNRMMSIIGKPALDARGWTGDPKRTQ